MEIFGKFGIARFLLLKIFNLLLLELVSVCSLLLFWTFSVLFICLKRDLSLNTMKRNVSQNS